MEDFGIAEVNGLLDLFGVGCFWFGEDAKLLLGPEEVVAGFLLSDLSDFVAGLSEVRDFSR